MLTTFYNAEEYSQNSGNIITIAAVLFNLLAYILRT
jgi:hypothetical protein